MLEAEGVTVNRLILANQEQLNLWAKVLGPRQEQFDTDMMDADGVPF